MNEHKGALVGEQINRRHKIDAIRRFAGTFFLLQSLFMLFSPKTTPDTSLLLSVLLKAGRFVRFTDQKSSSSTSYKYVHGITNMKEKVRVNMKNNERGKLEKIRAYEQP